MSEYPETLNTYEISYYYQDMGGGGPDIRPKLKINAVNEIQAAFLYNIIMGWYKHINYENFLKLPYVEKKWGLTIKLLTDIPNTATFNVNNSNLKGLYF